MSYKVHSRILHPEETVDGDYVVVIEGWHIKANDEQHAQRIIDACNMAAAISAKVARAEIRLALGLRSYGDHVERNG